MSALRSSIVSAGRVNLALALSLIACGAVSVVVGANNDLQTFEAFGAVKRYGLPITYLLFAVVLLMPHKGPYPRAAQPVWWSSLLGLLLLSTALAMLFPRQRIDVTNLLQGVALIGGLLLVSWAGLTAAQSTGNQQLTLIAITAIASVLTQMADVSLGPFISLTIPATAGLIYAGVRLRRYRALYLLSALILIFTLAWDIYGQDNVSIAVLTQIATSLVLLVILLTPHRLRLAASLLCAIAAVAFLLKTSVPQLMIGNVPPGVDDVTLTHRAFETSAVFSLLSGSATSILFGMGPAGTVDLSDSPDHMTLVASGRSLANVDDVHFLTSWLLLKLGIFGLAWLVAIALVVLVVTLKVIKQKKPLVFDAYLLFFLLAGACSAIPAATHFFANPMCALALGLLVGRSNLMQASPGPRVVPMTETWSHNSVA